MFFSVKKPMRLAGKVYIPSICYSCPKFLEMTVEKLEVDGVVKTYEQRVYFQNGKELPTMKERKRQEREEKKIIKKEQKTKDVENF